MKSPVVRTWIRWVPAASPGMVRAVRPRERAAEPTARPSTSRIAEPDTGAGSAPVTVTQAVVARPAVSAGTATETAVAARCTGTLTDVRLGAEWALPLNERVSDAGRAVAR